MIADKREGERAAARAGGSGIQRATGHDYAEWFAVLDEWGAPGRPFREIADWLAGEHRLSSWWAQKLIVEYEQARGLRPAGARPDGTFSCGASKTVAVPVSRLYQAFMEPKERERWLTGVTMRERTSRRDRSARFDWADGATRISVTFEAKDAAKSQVTVEHERVPDAKSADAARAFWRERLAALKTMIETPRT